MFGREIKVSLVKPNRKPVEVEAPRHSKEMTPEDIVRLTTDVVKRVALGAVLTFAAVVAVQTASEIAVNRLSKNEEN